MLQQLLHSILVSIIMVTWGVPLLLANNNAIQKDNFWFHSAAGLIAFLFLSGCLVVSIVSSWLCLLIPLKFTYLLILTLPLLLYVLIFRRKKFAAVFAAALKQKQKFSLLEYLFLTAGIFLFLLMGSLKPSNPDTQIYHLQIIRWQNEFGVVPGIANLFGRFGLGSNWFNLVSFFYLPFKHESFSYVNISFVSWFFIWLFSKWKYHAVTDTGNKSGKTLFFYYFALTLFFFCDWQLFRDASNSTNYDFAVTALTIISFSYFFEGILDKRKIVHFSPVLLLFMLAVVSFKFSGIFIGFLVLYYIISSKSLRSWFITAGLAVLVIIPGLVKNYITTGYPLFPYPMAVGAPDWLYPKDLAVGIYKYILDYNRFFNYWTFIGKVPETPFNWLPFWLRGILVQHKIVLFVSLLSIVFLFIKPRMSDINYSRLRHILVILLLMITCWFLTAPDPGRFGYGSLLTSSFIVASLAIGAYFTLPLYKLCVLAIIIATGIYTFNKSAALVKEPSFFLTPMTSEKPPFKTLYVDGIPFHLPEIIKGNWDHRCYNTLLPCICQENPYLQPRGKNISQGFRMTPYPDSTFIKKYEY